MYQSTRLGISRHYWVLLSQLWTSTIITHCEDRCQIGMAHGWMPLHWRHIERDGVSNEQPHDRLFNRLLGHKSKKTSKLSVTGLCEGNSPVTREFPAQRASYSENVSIWWRHHELVILYQALKHNAVRKGFSTKWRTRTGNILIYSFM